MLPILRAFDGLQISTPQELFDLVRSPPAQTAAPSGKKKTKNPDPSPDSNNKKKKKTKSIVRRFDAYFGSGALADWQRLCRDVGLEGEYPTKNQCTKALKTVYVNIYDLLEAVNAGKQVRRFKNQWALAEYCRDTGKIYPKKMAKKSGPVRHLLRIVF